MKKKKQQCRVLCSSGVVPVRACNAGKWGKSTQLKFTCAKRAENKNNININKGKIATRSAKSELKMKWVIFLICTGKHFSQLFYPSLSVSTGVFIFRYIYCRLMIEFTIKLLLKSYGNSKKVIIYCSTIITATIILLVLRI